MSEEKSMKDFIEKFSELTESNQRYIVGVQQALLYAQDVERNGKKKQCEEIF